MKRIISILLVVALMVAMMAVGPAAMAKPGKGQAKKVTICHNGHTIKVSKKAAAKHLKKHLLDYAGPCVVS